MNSFPRKKSEQTELQWKHLNKVIDPELGIGIVDLGLVYDFSTEKDVANVTITLTSPGCPLAPVIIQDIETTLLLHNKNFSSVHTEIVWDPPWTSDRMDPDLRDMLMGI